MLAYRRLVELSRAYLLIAGGGRSTLYRMGGRDDNDDNDSVHSASQHLSISEGLYNITPELAGIRYDASPEGTSMSFMVV